MNQSELIEKVAQATELNQAAAGQAVKAVVNAILGVEDRGFFGKIAGHLILRGNNNGSIRNRWIHGHSPVHPRV